MSEETRNDTQSVLLFNPAAPQVKAAVECLRRAVEVPTATNAVGVLTDRIVLTRADKVSPRFVVIEIGTAAEDYKFKSYRENDVYRNFYGHLQYAMAGGEEGAASAIWRVWDMFGASIGISTEIEMLLEYILEECTLQNSIKPLSNILLLPLSHHLSAALKGLEPSPENNEAIITVSDVMETLSRVIFGNPARLTVSGEAAAFLLDYVTKLAETVLNASSALKEKSETQGL